LASVNASCLDALEFRIGIGPQCQPVFNPPSFTLLISIRSRTPPNWLAFFFPVLSCLSRLPLHPADGAQQTTSPFPWLHRQAAPPSSLRRRRPSLPSPSNRAALPSLRRCAGELRLPPSPFAGGPRNRAALPSLIQPVSPPVPLLLGQRIRMAPR
jgi:hypothetical protein